MKRTILAFVLTPLILVAALYHNAGILVALIYSYLLTYLFGFPAFMFLKKRKKETHARYAFCGGVAAAVVALVLFQGIIPIILIFSVIGIAEGLCFSFIRGNERKYA